jgi:hypothetical protein
LSRLYHLFLRAMSQVPILILGILIFASLDMSEEAKWLFDIVQPWMDKTRSILC